MTRTFNGFLGMENIFVQQNTIVSKSKRSLYSPSNSYRFIRFYLTICKIICSSYLVIDIFTAQIGFQCTYVYNFDIHISTSLSVCPFILSSAGAVEPVKNWVRKLP